MNKPTITTGHAGWSPDYKSDRPLRLIPRATICCQTCGKPKPEDACECRGSLKTMLEVGPILIEALRAMLGAGFVADALDTEPECEVSREDRRIIQRAQAALKLATGDQP